MNSAGINWHEQFSIQAKWTALLRKYIYITLNLNTCKSILEVGSGTGVITRHLNEYTQSTIFGLDIDFSRMITALKWDPSSRLINGNAQHLPFSNECMDAVLCHYFLLWLPNPQEVLQEMVRVTHPSGYVIALAEPDYEGRIDYPPALEKIGRMQTESLILQGLNPKLGRSLGFLFSQAGLTHIHTGLMGGEWSQDQVGDLDSEWRTMGWDLKGTINNGDVIKLRSLDQQAVMSGERILFVPTFFAWGQKAGV